MRSPNPLQARPPGRRDSSGLGETLGVSSSGAELGQPSVYTLPVQRAGRHVGLSTFAQGHCAKLWSGQLASYSAFTCLDKQGEALVIHRLRGDAEPSSGAGNGQLHCLHPAWT